MRKAIHVSQYVLLGSFLFLYSCKKNVQDVQRDDQSKTELATKVNNWLIRQATTVNQEYNQRVERLKENLEMPGIRTEALEEGEKLVIVPINAKLKLVNNRDKQTTNILLLVLNKAGEIRKGNIVQYESLAPVAQTLAANFFHDFYSFRVRQDCKLTFLAINDRYLHDYEFRNNRLDKYRVMAPKSQSQDRSTNGCTDWYLVTTIHFADGSSQSYEEFVTRTCNGVCGPVSVVAVEGYICDPTYGMGIGNNNSGQTEYVFDNVSPVTWTAYNSPDGFNVVRSHEYLKGYRSSAGGFFTGITHNADRVENYVGPMHSREATWHKNDWNWAPSSDKKTATTTIDGILTYNSSSAPNVEVKNKSKTWTANTDL